MITAPLHMSESTRMRVWMLICLAKSSRTPRGPGQQAPNPVEVDGGPNVVRVCDGREKRLWARVGSQPGRRGHDEIFLMVWRFS